MKVEDLSNSGFCFLWILNSQMEIGYSCMNKWGYEVVDHITWIKTKNMKINVTHGYYFLHSSETCLVGYKNNSNHPLEFISKVNNDLIFQEVTAKSQKPAQLYSIIDLLMPASKKIELFARNHNLREGWLSLGNQLGDSYNKWNSVVQCDLCHHNITHLNKRY
jgi:mRNA m6A methyltransferase catalytic subunit